jgi:hypothetical protein
MKQFLSAWLALAALAGVTVGCSDSTASIPSAPTIEPASITDSFTGTLTVQGFSTHNFVVITTSRVAVTVTSIVPQSAPQVGVGIGVPTGVTCALTLGSGASATVSAASTPQINGTVVPGTFCVVLYDLGTLTESVDYAVTVAHS